MVWIRTSPPCAGLTLRHFEHYWNTIMLMSCHGPVHRVFVATQPRSRWRECMSIAIYLSCGFRHGQRLRSTLRKILSLSARSAEFDCRPSYTVTVRDEGHPQPTFAPPVAAPPNNSPSHTLGTQRKLIRGQRNARGMLACSASTFPPVAI